MSVVLNTTIKMEEDKDNLKKDNKSLYEINEGIKRQFHRKIDDAFEIIFNDEALLKLDIPILLNKIKNIIKEKC